MSMNLKKVFPIVILVIVTGFWIKLNHASRNQSVVSSAAEISLADCGKNGTHRGCNHGPISSYDPEIFADNELRTRERLLTKIPVNQNSSRIIESVGADSDWKSQIGGAVRARQIKVSPKFLNKKPFRKGEVLTLNLFDDVVLDTVVYESISNVNETVSTTARVANTMFGRAVMAYTENELRVKVILPESNKFYEIQYNHNDGNHYVLEMDPLLADKDPCGTVAGSPFVNPPAAASEEIKKLEEPINPPLILGDEGVALVVIDTMVVYSDNVVTSAGSEANVKNIAAQGMALANDAHITTNTGMYINLIHTARLTGYTDSGSPDTDLPRVTNLSDGYIDIVHTWRDNCGADFVHMMHSVGGGTGWRPNFASTGPGRPDLSFSVTGWSSFASYTPTHEMGHNMNLDHSKFQADVPGSPIAPTGTDAAGWHWHPGGNTALSGNCSVMSYTTYSGEAGHVRTGLFSDPNIIHNGQPAGDITDANAARVLRAYKNIYAGYRTRPLAANSILVESPNGGEVMSRGETVQIRWNSNAVAGSIKIDLYKGGIFEREVTAGTINDRIYYYTIPNDLPSSNLYKLRVSSVNSQAIEDFSDVYFTITQSIYATNLDANPGFTISGGGWAYGAPGGSNPTYGGSSAAYTGTNIYDTNLTGVSSTTNYLTTPAIDCSNFQGVNLKFAGWFSVTSGYQANVEVSNNGTTWTSLSSVSNISVSAWSQYSYDISAVANGQSTVYVRWVHLRGAGGGNYSGMSVDDVAISGVTLATAPLISASASTLASTTLVSSSPSNQTFTVRNAGIGTLNYTISDNQTWLSVSPSSGNSTGEEDTITVSYSTSGLGEGTYSATITVSDNAAGNSPVTIPVSLSVTLPPIYYASMDTNPGWTLDAGSGWAFGQPGGLDEDTIGNPAPTSGFNGTNVMGYNLAGDYGGSISSTKWATTPAFDCRGRKNVTLSFKRWLGVEGSAFDHAYIEVSKNGSAWTNIWQNSSTTNDDGSWVSVQYDISAVADGQATVYIRWGMGITDPDWNYCGWNIDEVVVNGVSPYGNWSGGPAMSVDSNGDGIRNGVAWVLGATNTSSNATALLPILDNTTDPNYFIYTYRRNDVSFADANTTIAVQYGSSLSSWTAAVHDGSNIIIAATNDFYGAGVDKVEVKIKRTLAVGNKLFCRMSVNITP